MAREAPRRRRPAARACHDIAVHVELRLAAAACAEQGQVWRVDDNGIPDTGHPILIDDEVSSGGTGNIPGLERSTSSLRHVQQRRYRGELGRRVLRAHHGERRVPPTTDWAARAWHPAGTHKTGRMFFSDLASGAFLSEFQVEDLRPEPGAWCSAHMGCSSWACTRTSWSTPGTWAAST
jgi:hypothetical protein